MQRSVLKGVVAGLVIAVAVGVLLVGFGLVPGPAPTDEQDDDHSDAALPETRSTEQTFDRNQYRVTVHDDGSATWSFVYEKTLQNQSDVEAFETFAQRYNEEELPMYQEFVDQARALAQVGANQTGRDMEAGDFERLAEVRTGLTSDTGVVEQTFHWSEFASVDDDGRVVVNDVFDGIYLGARQSLIFETGDGMRFDSVLPADSVTASDVDVEQSSTVTWQGEIEFADGRPRLVLVPEDWVGTTGGTDQTGGNEGPTGLFGDGATVALVLAGVALAVALVAGFVWHRGRNSPVSDDQSDAATAASTPVSEELLSDEDRVVQLIRDNGGRMKQVNIVEETEWSKSKVSMLLSDMEEEGTISKLRVGRENIVSLQGFEPEATRSPFED